MPILGQIWPFLAKILILTGESKIFGIHITEEPQKLLIRIIFWPAMGSNAYFEPNLAVFGPKILTLMVASKSFTHVTEKPPRHLVHINFWSSMDQKCQNLAKKPVLGQIWPFMGQKSYFLWG